MVWDLARDLACQMSVRSRTCAESFAAVYTAHKSKMAASFSQKRDREMAEIDRLKEEIKRLKETNQEQAELNAKLVKKTNTQTPTGFAYVAALANKLNANLETHLNFQAKRPKGAALPVVVELIRIDSQALAEIRKTFPEMCDALDEEETKRRLLRKDHAARKEVVGLFKDDDRNAYSGLKSETDRNQFVEDWKQHNPGWEEQLKRSEPSDEELGKAVEGLIANGGIAEANALLTDLNNGEL